MVNLTPKDLRFIELYEKYNRGDLSEKLDDYHRFIDTLFYIHEAISDNKLPVTYWQKPSEVLLHKFILHSFTLRQILSGLKLSSRYINRISGITTIDTSSAKAVLRAQLESFLMYHYIYINPSNDDLKELRFNSWIYSSLLQRQDFPAETEFAKKQKQADLVELEKMRETISKLKSFKELTPKQQKSLLSKGSGKLFNHWATILEETGFSEQHRISTYYALLSMYSHSEGLSAIQLSYNPFSKETLVGQSLIDLDLSILLVCLMINSITEIFPVVNDRYETLPDELKYDIEFYSKLAMKEARK